MRYFEVFLRLTLVLVFTLGTSVGLFIKPVAAAGPPASITVFIPSDNQITMPNTAFSTALFVTVRDAANVGVPNETVYFTVNPSGGAGATLSAASAVTDLTGVAMVIATANSGSGPYTVTANINPPLATPATFHLRNSAVGLQVWEPSNNQSALINTVFANEIWVRALDSGGNPVSGQPITFTAPAIGASAVLATTFATTDVTGWASTSMTANSTPGSYIVSITSGSLSASVSLINSAAIDHITVVPASNNQLAVINQAFLQPLWVQVFDASNNPIGNVPVTFTVPGSGASATLTSTVDNTDGTGSAVVNATANGTAGDYVVNVSAGPATTTINLSNSAGPTQLLVAPASTNQVTLIDTPFPQQVAVQVLDALSRPLPNQNVTFTPPGSGASALLSATTDATDASGWAIINAQANSTPGGYDVVATISGLTANVHLTNTSTVPASISIVSGDAQSATISTAFGAPLVVVVRDAGGTPIPNIPVTFTAPVSGASAVVTGSPALTDGSGQATVTVAANSTSGTYSVSADAGSGVNTSFTLTNNPGAPATITVLSGDAQSVPINGAFAPLVVEVRDSGNNLVPNVSVTFTDPASGASAVLTGSPATTAANGQASVGATANTVAGTYTVTADAGGGITTTFSLTNLPGAPVAVNIISGNPQSVTIGTVFAPLVVEVVDSGNNPVPGVSVTFTANGTTANAAVTGSPATTAANGQASATATANTVSGTYTVTADTGGGLTATFNLTNAPGPAATITVISGNTQSAQINTAFAAPLVVEVRDASNNVVPGVSVTFTVPGSGASAAVTGSPATTDANGQASVTATANSTAGAFVITADAGSGLTQTFNMINTPGAATSILIISGDPQSVTINGAFAPLVVEVRDGGGNPVPGVSVSFTSNGATATALIASSPVTTDATGQASASATANAVSGTYTVTADAGGGLTATFNLTNNPGPITSLTIVSGDGQSAAINSAFAQPLVVQARDVANNPIPGLSITFTANGGTANAVISGSPATTDASGQATVTATANATIGSYTVTADAGGGNTVTFNLGNITSGPAVINIVSGNAQGATISTAFTNPLMVQVLDAGGNPVSGVTVTFTVPGSGASAVLSSTTATTDATGHASVTATATSTAGTYNIVADVGGGLTQTFNMTNLVGAPASMVIIAGDGQSAVINTPFMTNFTVEVRDSGNNPVPGVSVTFTAPGSGASAVVSGSPVTTGANGQGAVSSFANGTAGSYTVIADAGSGITATFNISNTPIAPASINIVSGDGQTTQVGTAFGAPLVVEVRDNLGQLMVGVPVTFTAPGSGAGAVITGSPATTDGSGQASVTLSANNTAGLIPITADAGGGVTTTFNLTSTPGAAANIVVISGTPQSAGINTAFMAPLVVEVQDSFGNPVPTHLVNFDAPVSGASAVIAGTPAMTGANGRASVTATANGVTGSFAITADAGVATTVSFNLSNTAGTPASIEIISGTPQSAATNAAFAAPLVVRVLDASSNPVSGAMVTFTAPGSGASAAITGSPATTAANGQASVNVTANSTAGTYNVTASVGGVATTVDFVLTNTANIATQIVIISGSPQSTSVSAAFPAALVAEVRDSGGNPVSGVQVTFSAPGSGASASLSTTLATSDATGRVSVTATANGTAGAFNVTATAAGVATPVNFSLSNLTSVPSNIVLISGSPQTTTISTAFGAPLVVQVLDGSSNPVQGVAVNFGAPGSGASAALSSGSVLTDASGYAQVTATANGTAGAYNVTASAAGVTPTVSFSLTNTAGVAANIVIISGSPQSTGISAGFAAPLVVEVRDSGGNPVSGVTVTFTAPGSGAGASITGSPSTTGVNGQASVNATANGTVGSYSVTASAAGVGPTVSFSLTNTAGVPTSLVVIGGGAQSTGVNTAFPNPLIVEARDSGGNPVQGVIVTFSAPGSGASASIVGSPATTAVNGQASVTVTANGVAGGPYNVTATASGLTATFSLTNTSTGTLPLTVNASCVGDNYVINIVNGDSNFSISGSGPDVPQFGVPTGMYTLYGPSAWTGLTVSEESGDFQVRTLGDVTCPSDDPGTSTSPQIGIVVPNNGLVMIRDDQRQPVYWAPNSDYARDSDGNVRMLPVDADSNGFDTYTVTEIQIINDEIWLALFVGSPVWLWVPIDGTVPLTVLPILE